MCLKPPLLFSWKAGWGQALHHWRMSLFFPLCRASFSLVSVTKLLRPVWRVLTWIFCIQAFHIHVIYSLRIQSVKALIITIPFILWRCEISPSKIIWRLERLIAKTFHSWQSRIPSPWWWIGTKAASSLCTWQWLDSGRIGTRWPGWSCLCGCKRRTPVWVAEEESVSQKLLWFSSILSSVATTNLTMREKNPFRAFCNLIFIVSSGVYESVEHCLWIKSPQKS